MINVTKAKSYCCEDISMIENYAEATNSDEKYAIHHKLGLWFNKQWLIDNGFYYKQRAEMLIFMKESEHKALHLQGNKWNCGRKASKETLKKLSDVRIGHFVSKETRIKISEANRGHKLSEQAKKKMSERKKGILNQGPSKKVIQLSKDGEFIAEFPSAREAQRKTGVNFQKISLCCNGKRKTAYGFVWRFVE